VMVIVGVVVGEAVIVMLAVVVAVIPCPPFISYKLGHNAQHPHIYRTYFGWFRQFFCT
jgi:hypothetical protein